MGDKCYECGRINEGGGGFVHLDHLLGVDAPTGWVWVAPCPACNQNEWSLNDVFSDYDMPGVFQIIALAGECHLLVRAEGVRRQ